MMRLVVACTLALKAQPTVAQPHLMHPLLPSMEVLDALALLLPCPLAPCLLQPMHALATRVYAGWRDTTVHGG